MNSMIYGLLVLAVVSVATAVLLIMLYLLESRGQEHFMNEMTEDYAGVFSHQKFATGLLEEELLLLGMLKDKQGVENLVNTWEIAEAKNEYHFIENTSDMLQNQGTEKAGDVVIVDAGTIKGESKPFQLPQSFKVEQLANR